MEDGLHSSAFHMLLFKRVGVLLYIVDAVYSLSLAPRNTLFRHFSIRFVIRSGSFSTKKLEFSVGTLFVREVLTTKVPHNHPKSDTSHACMQEDVDT